MQFVDTSARIIKPDFHLYKGFAQHLVNSSFATSEFTDECLILAQDFGNNAENISQDAVETAQLAYKILRKKLFYWEARERLIAQQFKITARKLMRLSGDSKSIALAVICISFKTWWVGVVGKWSVYLYRGGRVEKVIATAPDNGKSSDVLLGQSKYISPFFTSGNSENGDTFLICTDSLPLILGETKLQEILLASQSKKILLEKTAQELINQVIVIKEQENYAALLVKKSYESSSTAGD